MPAICVIAFSDYPDLLKRCLQSIITKTPPGYQLILCLNQVGKESLNYAHSLSQQGFVDTLIISKNNIGVEGALSLALSASRQPVLVRMDDDSYCIRDGWMDVLMREVSTLPDTWGACGRLVVGAPCADLPPGQGYISQSWARKQKWFRPGNEGLLYQKNKSISGGFCALNVVTCLKVGYPTEYGEYGSDICWFEEDAILSLQMRMMGYTLHESNLISKMAMGADVKNTPDNPMVAIGDAPSRTDRQYGRKRWKNICT